MTSVYSIVYSNLKGSRFIFSQLPYYLCDPEGTQTPNLLIRSQMLYSVKLRDLILMRMQR